MKITLNDLLNAKGVSEPLQGAVKALIDRLEAAESDGLEQARLNGIGAEKELALMAKLEAAEKERDALRAAVCHEADCVEVAKAEIAALRAELSTEKGWIEDYKKQIVSLQNRLEAAEKERDWNAERLEDAIEEWTALRAELETERMRLTACGVVAMSNTTDSAKQARDMSQEYWSASCGDVARMVDENIELRTKIAEMEKQEPVGEIRCVNSTGNYIYSDVWVPLPAGTKLYALPGAKGE